MTSTNTKIEGHLDDERDIGLFSEIILNLELETSTTTTVDLPRSHHLKLPAELNQQIFLCLKPATQCKFIWGLNWAFYAMFRYRVLRKVFMTIIKNTGN
jgi:hypothetical protein